MNKKTAEQIDGHKQKIKEICTKRIQYLEDWIREHKSFEYGARYWGKIEEYQKEVRELQSIINGTRESDLARENISLKAKNNDYKWLLQKCRDKMTGYGEFEVLIRKINDYL